MSKRFSINSSFQRSKKWKSFLILLVPVLALSGFLSKDILLHKVLVALSGGREARHQIKLIARSETIKTPQGVVVKLNNGVEIPPITVPGFSKAMQKVRTQGVTNDHRRLLILLQTNSLAIPIAADLEHGLLKQFVVTKTFDTDRFFANYFLPRYLELCGKANVEPEEALLMLEHALLTLRAPAIRDPQQGLQAFNREEIEFTNRQAVIERALRGDFGYQKLLAHQLLVLAEAQRVSSGYENASVVELLTRAPSITFGMEEATIAHARMIATFHGTGEFSASTEAMTHAYLGKEREKDTLRSKMTQKIDQIADSHSEEIIVALSQLTSDEWKIMGISRQLGDVGAEEVNGSTLFGVTVSRYQKRGLSLEDAVHAGADELTRMVKEPSPPMVASAIVRDRVFSSDGLALLSAKVPDAAIELGELDALADTYRGKARESGVLEIQLYNQLLLERQDIGVEPLLKQTVGFYAHFAALVDESFAPANPASKQYQEFRRMIVGFMREAPDMLTTGGAVAPMRLFGSELVASPDISASSAKDAPVVSALSRAYKTLRREGLLQPWDADAFYGAITYAALRQSGLRDRDIPTALQKFRQMASLVEADLLIAVGPDGMRNAGTLFGVQSQEGRIIGLNVVPNLDEISKVQKQYQVSSSRVSGAKSFNNAAVNSQRWLELGVR
jgi:hypothetical protein